MISPKLVSRRMPTSYHGAKKKKIVRCCLGDGVVMCWCCSPCSRGSRGSHNEYYHISARLHLSQIILLPSRAWANIKGSCVILHSCQSITTSGASPLWWKAQPHSLPQPSLMIFQRHTPGLVAQCTTVEESSETPLLHYLFSLFMMHVYFL